MGTTQCVRLSILSYLRFVCILNRNEPEEIVVECDWYEKVGDNTFSMSLLPRIKLLTLPTFLTFRNFEKMTFLQALRFVI